MDETSPRRTLAWIAFALVAIVSYSNFYVYDSIGPVADLLQQQRGFSDTRIGMLNAIYSLPNVVLIMVGGVLVDRFGAGRMLAWSTAVCLLGAVLTAFGPDFTDDGGRAAALRHRRRDPEHRDDGRDRRLVCGWQDRVRDGPLAGDRPVRVLFGRYVAGVVLWRVRRRLAAAARHRRIGRRGRAGGGAGLSVPGRAGIASRRAARASRIRA